MELEETSIPGDISTSHLPYAIFAVTIKKGRRKLLLGYVWHKPGWYWQAKQPGRPWRGKFVSKLKAAEALKQPYLPQERPKYNPRSRRRKRHQDSPTQRNFKKEVYL